MGPEIFNKEELNHLEEMKKVWNISPEEYWELLKASKERAKIDASIEESLASLDSNSTLTIEQRVEEKIKLIKERLKKEKWLIDQAKSKAEEELKKKKQEALNQLREKADKVLPFWIWWAIFDWAKEMIDSWKEAEEEKSFFWKIFWWIWAKIGLAILWMFGLKKWYEAYKNMKDEWNQEQVWEKWSWEVVGDKKKEEVKGAVEVLTKNKYSTIGFFLLSKTCSINKHPKALFDYFTEKNYSELREEFVKMDNDWEMKEQEVENFKIQYPNLASKSYTNEQIYNMLKLFCGSKTAGVLYKQRLSKDKIKAIFEKNDNQKLEEILWKGKIQEIKAKNYDFTKLDLQTITTLLWLSYKSLVWAWFATVYAKSKNFFTELFSEKDSILGEMKEEAKERQENLLPPKVLATLKSKLFSPEEVNVKENELTENQNLSPKELEKLTEFLKFRDDVVEFMWNNTNKYALWLSWFGENFKKVINLKEILYLYFAFDWKTDFLTTQDSLIKWGIYAWVYKLLKDKEKTSNFAWEYISTLEDKAREWANKYLSEDDKIFVDIFVHKLTWVFLLPLQKQLMEIEWITRNKLTIMWQSFWITDKNLAEQLAYATELAATGFSALVLKKLKLLRFVLIPALVYLIPAFILKGYNKHLEKSIGKENYEVFKKWMDDFMKENPVEVETTTKQWQKKSTKVKSLQEAEEFYNNPKSVIEQQHTIENYILKDWKLTLDTSYSGYEVRSDLIVFQKDGSDSYFIKYLWKNYKVGFKNNLEKVPGVSPTYNGKEVNFSNLPKIEWEGLVFWIGNNQIMITYAEIEKALKYWKREKGSIEWYYYILKKQKDNWAIFNVNNSSIVLTQQ